jgi:hypothetical protein
VLLALLSMACTASALSGPMRSASPDFSYRVGFRGGDGVRDGSANEGKDGCGLNRLTATFASPFEGNGPQGGLPGLFWPRFLVRQAVAAASAA